MCLQGDTALLAAAKKGSTECIDVLLENGVDVHVLNNVSNKHTSSVVYLTFFCMSFVYASYLHLNSLFFNYTKDNQSAVYFLANVNKPDALRTLLARGVDPSIADKNVSIIDGVNLYDDDDDDDDDDEDVN